MATKKKTSNSSSKKKAASKASPAKRGTSKTAATSKPKPKTKPKTKPKAKPKTKAKIKAKNKVKTKSKAKASSSKKKPAKKKASAKTISRTSIPSPRGRKPAPRHREDDLEDEPIKPKVKPMSKRDLKKFKMLLLELRDRLQGDIRFLTTDNLHRVGRETGADLSGAAQHSADHGTDNFDREFALSLASAEEDVMYEVDEALIRIAEGTYGICEETGVRIETARLEVIPYTRYSVQAQAKMEQRRAGYRPFGQSFKKW